MTKKIALFFLAVVVVFITTGCNRTYDHMLDLLSRMDDLHFLTSQGVQSGMGITWKGQISGKNMEFSAFFALDEETALKVKAGNRPVDLFTKGDENLYLKSPLVIVSIIAYSKEIFTYKGKIDTDHPDFYQKEGEPEIPWGKIPYEVRDRVNERAENALLQLAYWSKQEIKRFYDVH